MRILALADIHVGAIKDVHYFYRVITNIIEKEVVFGKTDMVVLLGDYFDRLFKANEEYVPLAINIMSYLVRACMRRDTKIRIVYGTESHEMNQYRLFNYHLTSDKVDIKVFETVSEEEIDGKKILYIPEEYINDKKKHYQKYLYSGKHYDFIFGHGVIEDGMPENVSISAANKSNKEKQVPRFKSGELSAASDVCVFGHYHCFVNMRNGVFYLGSLFRWKFGEEIEKGYCVITDDDSNDTTTDTSNTREDNKKDNNNTEVDCAGYTFTFKRNDDSYPYITYEFLENDPIYRGKETLVSRIKDIKDQHAELFDGTRYGKIRFKFNITDDTVDSSFKENLRSILSNEKNITTLIKESSVELVNEIQEDIDDEWDFILDASLPIADKIHMYMTKMYSDVMSLDKLKEYLHIKK